MARFQVHRAHDSKVLLLDIQSGLFDILKTRVVIPLYPVSEMGWSMGKLNPRFEIDDVTYVMATQRMASVGIEDLGPVVCDLTARADAITAATDFLFQGF